MIARKSFFALAMAAALILAAAPAKADPKPWVLSWWPSHWTSLDFEPYLENGKHPHNSQWDNENWEPEDWIAQRPGQLELVRGFYRSDILRDQIVDDDMPVVIVGPNFYRLGGHDKRRLTETLDHIYQITSSRENGMFMLRDWKTKKPIGAYTAHGLQIQ